MSKEIGKLIELLNEYSKNIGYFNEEDLQGQTKAWILSKDFGWIRWLVENDKIDIIIITMVELLFEEIDSFADFHFGVEIFKEGEKFIMNINLFGNTWHINREFEMMEDTEEKAIEKAKRTVGLIRQIRIGCGILHKRED